MKHHPDEKNDERGVVRQAKEIMCIEVQSRALDAGSIS